MQNDEVPMTLLASRAARRLAAALAAVAMVALTTGPVPAQTSAQAQPPIDVEARLKGFDDYMAQVRKDWNAPGIRFYNDEQDRSVTIRDMLSHRTGVTRHDGIWYKSAFTRRELGDRLRYLSPPRRSAPPSSTTT